MQTRLVERAYQRLTAKIHCLFDENPVCFAEVTQPRIPLPRQNQVAAIDLGAGMQLPNYVFVTLEIRNAEEHVGEFALRIAMRGQRTEHTCDDAHWSHPLVYEDLGRKVQLDRLVLEV